MMVMTKTNTPVHDMQVISFISGHPFSPVAQLGRQRNSLSAVPLFFQPKLAIGEPDDAYEREADRVAETVMRMPNPKNIQRCACSKTIQRQSVNAANMDAVPSSVHEVLRSPGQPLDEEPRFYMEPRFGHDFCRVRIHADSPAGESARAINALAYTVGTDVVFGAGRYKSATANGQRLLAHELAHVGQQRTSPITLIQSQLKEEVGTSLEDEQVTMERAEGVAWSRKSDAMNEQAMLGE